MLNATKIATCCYCGTRAALVLRGNDRHELSCSSCGAPLHNMKLMPTRKIDVDAHGPTPSVRPKKTKKSGQVASNPYCDRKPAEKHKRKHSKSRKGGVGRLFRKAIEEAVDVIEDIFD